MFNLNTKQSEDYSEQEAAAILGISVSRLRQLLDENVFNDGSRRPSDLRLRSSDLILLEFWNRTTENSKIIRMPNRR